MSDPISDTYSFPAALSRPNWTKTMADDMRTLSITKVHLPIVLAIAVICAIAGGLMGVSWTAAAKVTTLDRVSGQVDRLDARITEFGDKIADQMSQLNKQQIQNQIELRIMQDQVKRLQDSRR